MAEIGDEALRLRSSEEIADALWLAARIAECSGHPSQQPGGIPHAPPPAEEDDEASGAGSPTNTARIPASTLMEEGEAETRVYLQTSKRTSPSPGSTSNWPISLRAPNPLPGSKSLGHGISKLRRRIPIPGEFELDEQYTVRNIADTDIWIPKFRPRKQLKFRALLLTETSENMRLWEPATREFRQLLKRTKTFRSVRSLDLVWGGETEPWLEIVLQNGSRTRRCKLREYFDPEGDTILFLLTDGISRQWRAGYLGEFLSQWTRSGPLVVVQMLPPSYWPRTSLGDAVVRLRRQSLTGPGLVQNDQKRIAADPTDAWAFPIIFLDEFAFRRFASFLTSSRTDIPAVRVNKRTAKTPLDPPQRPQVTARDRVKAFFSIASPEAQKLILYLAWLPLQWDVLRIAQQCFLNSEGFVHIAEVISSGLIRKSRTVDAPAELDFLDGVRQILQEESGWEEQESAAIFLDMGRGLLKESSESRHLSALAESGTQEDESASEEGGQFATIRAKEGNGLPRPGQSEGFPLFSGQDILDFRKFIRTMDRPSGPASRYVARVLKKRGLDTRICGLTDAVDALNSLLIDERLYSSRRFPSRMLGPKAKKLLSEGKREQSIECLNRVLLEKVFPGSLRSTQILNCLAENSGIFQSLQASKARFQKRERVVINYDPLPLAALNRVADKHVFEGRNLYDIILHYHWQISKFLHTDWLLAIRELDRKLLPGVREKLRRDIFPAVWEECCLSEDRHSRKPVPRSYPFNANTMVLVYNRRLFHDYRAPFQENYNRELLPPRTWDQLLDIARFFNRPERGTSGIVLQGQVPGDWLYFEWCNVVFSMGGKVIKKKHGWETGKPAAVTLDSKLVEMATEYYMELHRFNADENEIFFQTDAARQRKRMSKGDVALAIMWSDSLWELLGESSSDQFGFETIPGNVSIVAGGVCCVNNRALHLESTIKYAADLLSYDAQVELCRRGWCSAFQSVYEHPDVKSLTYAKAVSDSLARATYMIEAGNRSEEIRRIIGSALKRILQGTSPIRIELRSAQRRIEEVLAVYWGK